MRFEEKIEEIISRAKKIKNITKEIQELDQKVAFGINKAKTDIEHYSIMFEKHVSKDSSFQQESSLQQLYRMYTNSSFENLEYIIVTFDRLKRSTEKSTLLSDSDSGVVLLRKAFKIPVLTEGSMSIEFESSKIYETENINEIFKIYKSILLKEKELASENADRLRDKLMSL